MEVLRRGFLTTLLLPLIERIWPVGVATFPDESWCAEIKDGDLITISGYGGMFRVKKIPRG
jgi:hypothetical protein